MKKKYKLIVLAICHILLISGCRNTNKNIVDYKNLTITREMYDIEPADFNTAMEIYSYTTEEDNKEASPPNDQIKHNNSDLKKYVIDEMVKHRIYEEVIQYILDNNTINIQSMTLYESYITRINQNNELIAASENMNLTDYILTAYQMSVEEYQQYEEVHFTEYYLLKTILEQNGIIISKNEIDDRLNELAAEEEMTLDEAKNVFLEEDIEYLIISDKFYDFILDCYSEEITQACSDMEIKFGIT